MFNRVLNLVWKIGYSSNAEQRRVRASESKGKQCEFCYATISCHKKVCKNCYKPLSQGLAGEKWVSQELKRTSSNLAGLDSVKYNNSGSYRLPSAANPRAVAS